MAAFHCQLLQLLHLLTQCAPSAGHYNNMIDGGKNTVGVGHYTCDDGRSYWTQLFGN